MSVERPSPAGGEPSFGDVAAARARIAHLVGATPVVDAPHLGGVLLKAECLQVTGSFKVRGAANALLQLSPAGKRAGVVAVSSGNHGRAVAHVAGRLGVAATVCISQRVPESKAAAIRALGATVVVGGPGQDEAEAAAHRIVAGTGAEFIHPFDDARVIAGQGTLGIEIAEQVSGLAAIVVPVSGGGLAAGVALAVRHLQAGIRIIGVSQERGAAMYESRRAGRIVDVVEDDTLADALAGGLGSENHHTLRMCRELVDDIVLVTEEEIAAAMRHLRRHAGLRVEGGGAVGVAAVLAGTVSVPDRTVVILSGGNVGDEVWERVTG